MKRMITLLSAAVMLSAVSCSKVEQSTLNGQPWFAGGADGGKIRDQGQCHVRLAG